MVYYVSDDGGDNGGLASNLRPATTTATVQLALVLRTESIGARFLSVLLTHVSAHFTKLPAGESIQALLFTNRAMTKRKFDHSPL